MVQFIHGALISVSISISNSFVKTEIISALFESKTFICLFIRSFAGWLCSNVYGNVRHTRTLLHIDLHFVHYFLLSDFICYFAQKLYVMLRATQFKHISLVFDSSRQGSQVHCICECVCFECSRRFVLADYFSYFSRLIVGIVLSACMFLLFI